MSTSSAIVVESAVEGSLDVFRTYQLSDGNRSVTILASREEEDRINNDQEYATNRFLSAVADTSNIDEEEDFNHNATLLLIECVKDRFERFRSCRQGRYAVYKEIQEEFRSYAYNLSIDKIRSKWNNLVTTYKRIKFREKAGGLGKSVWNYFEPLDELLGPLYASAGPAGLSFLTNKRLEMKNDSIDFPQMPVVIQNVPRFQEVSTGPPVCASQLPSPSTTLGLEDGKRKYSESVSQDTEQCEDRGEKRQVLMEKYYHQIREKEFKDNAYRKRKERRERLKLRALQKIGRELQGISRLQTDILKYQKAILETIKQPDE